MKRAAVERLRTYHVWKQHHDHHLLQNPGEPIQCRCDLQIGRFRKGQKRFGCGKPRCYLCHGDKLLGIPKVSELRRAPLLTEGLAEIGAGAPPSHNHFEPCTEDNFEFVIDDDGWLVFRRVDELENEGLEEYYAEELEETS